ncbi:MAG: hypothetical protein ABIQ73_07475 [Acidimicrobiales bacterium]
MIRPMHDGDSEWAAGLMAERRAEYAVYSPVFWRPQAGIEPAHARFLGSQIGDPAVIAVRRDDGFAIAARTGDQYYVDDFAVLDGRWQDVGAELLSEIWRQAAAFGAHELRVVTARLDQPKVAMLNAIGFRLSQQWWVKPLRHTSREPAADGVLVGDGYRVIRTVAPPVYDPGGPVGMVQHFADAVSLHDAERVATDDGLVLLIAPLDATDPKNEAADECGFTVASQFYVGVPR